MHTTHEFLSSTFFRVSPLPDDDVYIDDDDVYYNSGERLNVTKAQRADGEYGRLSEEAERHESGDNHGHSLR